MSFKAFKKYRQNSIPFSHISGTIFPQDKHLQKQAYLEFLDENIDKFADHVMK